MTNREGDQLRHRIADVCADEQCGLAGFAGGLTTDLDAVAYGMSTDWSSGPVEGCVNGLRALKRSMFGRAKPPLLRKRLLLMTTAPSPAVASGAVATTRSPAVRTLAQPCDRSGPSREGIRGVSHAPKQPPRAPSRSPGLAAPA